MFTIDNYGHDKDIHLLNVMTMPNRPTGPVRPDGKRDWRKRRVFTVYRNVETWEKKVQIIDNPITHTYITKPKFRDAWNTRRKAVDINMLDRYEVEYDKLADFVYGKMKEFNADHVHEKDKPLMDIYENVMNGRAGGGRRKRMEVFKWRHAYYTDYDICDYIITQYAIHYKCSDMTLTKSYLDIEVDVYESSAHETLNHQRPITAVTMAFTHDKDGKKLKNPVAFQLYLRNYERYTQQKEFEENIEDYKAMLDRKYGNDFDHPKHIIKFYDDERELIRDTMGIIHLFKADYCGIYNLEFDIKYLTGRAYVLGINGEAMFHHPDFGDEPYYYFYKDEKNAQDFAESADSFDASCYTKFYCMLRAYARRRKHLSDYGGNSLDNVADIELGYGKSEFKDPRTDVINAAITSYAEFAEYAFKDTMLLYKLDLVTFDLDAIHDQAVHSGCRFNKVLNASYSAKTDFDISYHNDLGIIPGNNKNRSYEFKSKEQYEEEQADPSNYDGNELAGAVVADPDLNAYNGLEINGRPSNRLFGNVLYLDFEALYPNTKIKFQLSEDLQYFRVVIDSPILDVENPLGDEKWLRGGQFIEDYTSGDWCKIGRWFKLPDISQCIQEFREILESGGLSNA